MEKWKISLQVPGVADFLPGIYDLVFFINFVKVSQIVTLQLAFYNEHHGLEF